MTPEAVHHGRDAAILDQRQRVLAAAFAARPERFVRGRPKPPVYQKLHGSIGHRRSRHPTFEPQSSVPNDK
jgi:hypothetical protein